MKKKLKAVQNDFIKVQNKSKLVTINPIFNKKEYLGKNTEPLPIERFLIEMNFPQVQISYRDEVFSKVLTETDLEYLIRSNFETWMQYVINSQFRAELNVSKDQPIPRLQDLMSKEEISANQQISELDSQYQSETMSPFIQLRNIESPVKITREQKESQNRLS